MQTDGNIPEAIKTLLRNFGKNGISCRSIPKEMSCIEFLAGGARSEESLLIAAKDDTIEEIKYLPVAAVGYCNPEFSGQGLYRADILVEEFEEVDISFFIRVYQRKHNIPWRVIETDRCYLREMTLQDLDGLYEMYAWDGMTKYMEPLFERQEEEAYTKAYIENMYGFYGYGMWLVKDRVSHALIGRAGLNHTDLDGEPVLEMGYAIANPYQRQGYATEVCGAILDFAAKEELPFEKIYCFIHPGNQASEALMRKLSFEFLGVRSREGTKMLCYWHLLG